MPEKTEDEVKAHIAAGEVFGISVDTAIFDKFGCNLRFPTLRSLGQFKTAKEHIFISEIVRNEIVTHVARDAEETQRALKRAVRKHCQRWQIEAGNCTLPAEFRIDAAPTESAAVQVDTFIGEIGATLVPASGQVDIAGEAIRRYFAVEPPFANADAKKHEFPDAFALLSLEALSSGERGYLLCVSPDKGWRQFAAGSDHIICVESLDTVLAMFNETGRDTADRMMDLWRNGRAAALEAAVETAFEYRLSEVDFDADAYSFCEIDVEPVGAVMQSFDLDGASDPKVIAIDEDVVTFTTRLTATVEFETSVDFYARDSVDKDLVHLTSETFTTNQADEYELAITVGRHFEAEPNVTEVEIAKRRISVSFGDLEPFRDENPYHEKY